MRVYTCLCAQTDASLSFLFPKALIALVQQRGENRKANKVSVQVFGEELNFQLKNILRACWGFRKFQNHNAGTKRGVAPARFIANVLCRGHALFCTVFFRNFLAGILLSGFIKSEFHTPLKYFREN